MPVLIIFLFPVNNDFWIKYGFCRKKKICFKWENNFLPSLYLQQYRLRESMGSQLGLSIFFLIFVLYQKKSCNLIFFFGLEIWLSKKRSIEDDPCLSKCCSGPMEYGNYLGRSKSSPNVAEMYGGLVSQKGLEMGFFHKPEWIWLSNTVSASWVLIRISHEQKELYTMYMYDIQCSCSAKVHVTQNITSRIMYIIFLFVLIILISSF